MPNITPNQSYQISISLKKGCYRHILIDGDNLLFDLHTTIIQAFGFADEHLHAFYMDNKAWSKAAAFWDSRADKDILLTNGQARLSDKITLNQLDLAVGHKFKYIFDFGAEWLFQCKILRILPEHIAEPLIIKSVGANPEQDDYSDPNGLGNLNDTTENNYITFPSIYSRKKCTSMYKKLGLNSSLVNHLEKYFAAFVNLYGILPLAKAMEIYNSQNEPLDSKFFMGFAKIARHEDNDYYIMDLAEIFNDLQPSPIENWYIIDPNYLEFTDELVNVELEQTQSDKTFYIPEQKQLLKYADLDYTEPTPAYRALKKFLRKITASDNVEPVMSFICDIIKMENDLSEIIRFLENEDIVFENQQQMEKFLDLYGDLSNNTRMPHNLGHTPHEVFYENGPPMLKSISFGPNMAASFKSGELDIKEWRKDLMAGTSFPDHITKSMIDSLNHIEQEKLSGKIGRNEPCPCDSGKKYKRCCGKNQ